MSQANRFLQPQVLAALKNLQLVAKTVVDGFLLGIHANPKSGAGQEFSQYRGYQPGDDLRRLDWKMFARSDRYFIREAEIETGIGMRFVLDASASMAHRDTNGMTKFDYARYLAASLAYLAFQQGDAIGLATMGGLTTCRLPSRHHPRHLHLFLQTLETLVPKGEWSVSDEENSGEPVWQSRELVVAISDLYQHRSEILETLRRWAAMKNEIVVFHLTAANEWNLPYSGSVVFEDLETGRQVKASPQSIRDRHRRRLEESSNAWRAELNEAGIGYEPVSMDQPLDFALRSFLVKRAKLR